MGAKCKLEDTKSTQHDDSPPMSLRERKKRLAQAAIEETALRLFQQQGYEQTSIQDIANAVMMSSRTFFRYFASKEDVILEPMHAIQSEGLRFLQHAAPTESLHSALRATFEYLASLYQQQRASFLTRYHVVMQIPSLASIYLYALVKTEPVLCEALYSRLETATNRQEIRFLVALYMASLRVAIEEWLEQETQEDLLSLLSAYLDALLSLPTLPERKDPSSPDR
jgi:AcrR family transcriptional regulator